MLTYQPKVMKWVVRLCVLSMGIWLSVTASLAQDRRIALVIGNSNYSYLPPLSNPVQDAEAISQSLSALGFTVFLTTNLNRERFNKAIKFFLSRADNADTVLFYFAGHGATFAGRSFIFPIDFGKADIYDPQEAFDLEKILSGLGSDLRNSLVFIDACRDNVMQSDGFSNRGLFSLEPSTRVNARIGTLISFATTPGHVAFDGDSLHSPFTGALLDHLETPGVDIELMLKRVRRDVVVNSGGRQVPWTESSLLSPLHLAPRVTSSGDVSHYESIASALNPSLISVLSNTGFSQKPILHRISSGLGYDASQKKQSSSQGKIAKNERSARIKTLLCTVLKPPLPEDCKAVE